MTDRTDLIERLRALASDRAGSGPSDDNYDPELLMVAFDAASAIEALLAERDALRDILLRNGFVPCDIPACNCGSWHGRYGLHERMDEIRQALEDAGHPPSNKNGNLPINALRELVAERDALRRRHRELLAQLCHIRTHLYAATVQRSPSDDRIIADHVEQAYLRVRDVIHDELEMENRDE